MKPTKLSDLLEDDKSKSQWELGPNHEVLLKSDDKAKEIKFKGSLIGAEPDALVVSYTERESNQKVVTRLLKISGEWKLNQNNQITFQVAKKSGKTDVLTFTSSWKVGAAHEIVYTYEQTNLKTKIKEVQELAFKGYWDISEKNRLTYYVGGDTNNAFRFRGTFQTKSILAKKGEIRYQVGVEVAGKHKIQTITLFGKWIVSRNLNLSFEIEYDDNETKAITFGGTYALSDSADIIVNLKSQEGKPLGIELILTKEIFNGDGNIFIRLQKTIEESRVEAGMKFKF